jgi:hypothetical protein
LLKRPELGDTKPILAERAIRDQRCFDDLTAALLTNYMKIIADKRRKT